MSLQVRSGYINPLTTMTNTKQGHTLFGKNNPADKAADLQTKQQQLQNTLLLIKSTGTDGGVSTAEQQEKLQAELEKISEELQAAKNDVPQVEMLSQAEKAQGISTVDSTTTRPKMDIYEERAKEIPSPGIYQVRRKQNSGYQVSFIPYAE